MAGHIICFVSFRFVSFRFVSFRFDLFRFVSICFVSFRFVSFRFDLFRFVPFRFCFVSHFTGTRFNNHTSWMAVVTPSDRPKSICNRCVIEVFVGVFVLSIGF